MGKVFPRVYPAMYNAWVGPRLFLPAGDTCMRSIRTRSKAAATAALLLLAAAFATPARTIAQEMPRIVEQQGRATLMVDGAPYFLLGAQVDNSSGWPERLDAVWPAAEPLRLNTPAVPLYWEQP